ncbi:MAG: O-antigen ligase family protein [Elusimicrobiaceae bacterium]|nr:O-antigen ligase family protein [Elusimicrobiaceae bacterium]
MNLLLKSGVVFSLFFAPFAFASTPAWAFSILQCGVIGLCVLAICTSRYCYVTPPLKWITTLMLFLLGFALLQSFFPSTLLEPASWHPVTMVRLYTLRTASLFMTYLALVWLTVQVFPSFSDAKRILLLVALCGSAVALCAASLPKGAYLFHLAGVRGGFGPFMNRNHASIFLAMCAIGMLAYFFTSHIQYAKKVMTNQLPSFYLRQFCLAVIFLCLCAGVIFTRSRGGMLALTVGIFTYALLCCWAIPPQLKKKLKGVFLTLVALGIVSGWVATHIPQINAFAHRTSGTSEITRKMFYRSTVRVLKEYPYFGVGISTTPLVIPNYFEWSIKKYVNYLHCDWLELLLGMGYLGVIPVFLLLIGLGIVFLKRLKKLETKKQMLYSGLLSILVVMCIGSAVDFDFFIPADAFLFFLIAGLASSPSFSKGHTHLMPIEWKKKSVLITFCTLSIWIPLRETLAWRMAHFGKGLKSEAKIAAYEKAAAYYPDPRYGLRLAAAYYNAAVHSKQPQERLAFLQQANRVAAIYLQKYPKEKELSRIYMLTRSSR